MLVFPGISQGDITIPSDKSQLFGGEDRKEELLTPVHIPSTLHRVAKWADEESELENL